ncbi:MAG: SDR family oxidoreductase [Actinobacteria bacterium]|nr:SDR family oxidoreductase [Actinomycetota bacterium]
MASVTYDFTGSTIAITGAARGLGAHMAREFARAGADLALCDLEKTPAGLDYDTSTPGELAAIEEEVRELGAQTVSMAVDVRDEGQIQEFFAAAASKLGDLDVFVNNAGVFVGNMPVTETSEEQWDLAIDVNLKGPFLCTKHAVQSMVDGGRVIIIGSTSSLIGIPYQVPYQASKHGVIGAVRTLALELAPRGITVNALCPTVAHTPMLEYLAREEASYYLDEVARLAGAFTIFPGVEAIEPEDVSGATMWLASPAARYVTGAAFALDAGYTIK